MIYPAFGSNRPGAMVLILAPAAALAAGAFYRAVPQKHLLSGPLFDAVFGPVKAIPHWSILLNILAILAGAVLINVLYNRHEFASRENYFPSLVYTLLCGTSLQQMYLHPVLFANVALLLGLRRLLLVYRTQNPTHMLFDTGLLLAIAVFIFPPSAIFIPFIWISLLRLRAFNIREMMLPVAGIAVTIVYAASIYWWRGKVPGMAEFFPADSRPGLLLYTSTPVFSFWLVTISVALLGLGQFISEMRVSTVHKKNTKAVVLYFSLAALITAIYCNLLPARSVGAGLLLLPFISIYSGVFYAGGRKALVLQVVFYLWLALWIWKLTPVLLG